MSFSKKVNDLIEEAIKNYIGNIGDKYDIDPNELYKLWSDKSDSGKPITNKLFEIPKASDEISHDHLLSCKVPELKAMCKQRKLKCSGNKSELIKLLLGNNKDTSSPVKSPVKSSVKKVETNTPIIKKVISNLSTIPIRRNQFNNHEHPETCLVFDVKTKKVIGKQQDDGSVSDLTKEDIENCNKFKFEYVIPENLENKSILEDEKVDELEDEEEFIESDDDDVEELIEDDDENDFIDDDLSYEE
jgi:hypothetical protein